MISAKKWLPLALLALITGCGIKPPASSPVLEGGPRIKIGLMEHAGKVSFTLTPSSAIINEKSTFVVRRQLEGSWTASVIQSHSGKTVWFLCAASFEDKSQAQEHVRALRRQGHETFVYPAGQTIEITHRMRRRNAAYRVCLKQSFRTEDEARRFKQHLDGTLETFLVKHAMIPPGGTIRLVHQQSGQEFASTEPIIIKGPSITLHNVPVGTGFHWARKEDRVYPEDIIIQVGADGKLLVMNHLPIEEYLKGVVPTEMPNGFPLEALKAQAVTARSETLAKLGKAHTADLYDLCADVHCQAYSGLTKRDAQTDRAVSETHGEILMRNEEIIDAVYSAVCGGHGESASHAWGGEGRPYLEGSYDGPGRLSRYGRLSANTTAARWIDASPDAWCNTQKGPAVPAMEYTKKYFRWEERLTQGELRSQLEKQMGRSVGPILKLQPITRGDSGRITQLRVEGTTGSYIIEKELTIRRALKASTLWSSCFHVTAVKDGRIPTLFVLKGAGFGHGVGMCQTGAAGMALKGIHYRNILSHYYKGSRLRRIY